MLTYYNNKCFFSYNNMNRKSLEQLFSELQVTKKIKPIDKLYTQEEVNILLEEQYEELLSKFRQYINEMRQTSELNVVRWTSV